VSRLPALERLAGAIRALPRPARVAVDGVDAAGKTTLADELGALIPEAGRLSADEFLRPPEERYRRGRDSAEGYYLDSFDHDRLRAAVAAAPRAVLLVDGIFLLRRELNDLWDFRIFVQVEPEEALRRGVARDGADREHLYRTRYLPAQRLYLASVRPQLLADVVVDNNDPARPSLQPGRGRRPSVKNG
jgi:uridine kinase